MASEQLKHMNEFYESERFAHFPLEIDMTKSPTILTRRSIFRAGAALAVAATATPLFTPRFGLGGGRPSSRRGTPKRQWLLSLQDRRLPGDSDLGWLWADSGGRSSPRTPLKLNSLRC